MFAARNNTSRIVRTALRQTPTLARTSLGGQRALTISYPVFKANPVNEGQVPATIYHPDAKMPQGVQVTIPVRPEDKIAPAVPAVPAANEMDRLTTLSDEFYQMLPSTVKSMTVKGKVIIVTG